METFKQLNKFTRILLVAAAILILYGYLCRLAGLYFFWESKAIGWNVLLLGLAAVLRQRIKIKRTAGVKPTGERIGFGFIIFVLLFETIFAISIPNTDAWTAAKKHLVNNETLQAEVGNIKSFSVIPVGGMSMSSGNGRSSGEASISLTVKGDKKFKDVDVYIVKYDSTEWHVEAME